MKKSGLFVFLFSMMLSFGFVFVSCDHGGGGDGNENGTPNVINGYWGVTNDGKNIEIVITPSVSSSVVRAVNWSTGDYYVAKVDGVVVSRGTIVASGGSISFTATDGSSVNITGSGIVINSSAGTTYSGTIVPARDYFYCIGASTDYTKSEIDSSFTGKTPEEVYNYCSTTGSHHFDWPETQEGTWKEMKALGKRNACPNGVIADIGNTLNVNGNVSAWGYYRHPDGYNVMFYIAKVPIVNN
jgi:hypothetical protein